MSKGVYERTAEVKERERLRCVEWNKKKKGIPLNPEHKVKVVKVLSRFWVKGSEHHSWIGDRIGYHGLHNWVRNTKGRPTKCEHCGATEGKLQWANKSGKYLRDEYDWIQLCVRCHDKYDNVGELIANGIKRREVKENGRTTKNCSKTESISQVGGGTIG